jgi:mono/diheme cytochrome c family protein
LRDVRVPRERLNRMSWQRSVFVVGAVFAVVSVTACSSSSDPGTTPASTGREAATVAKGLEAVGKRKCPTCHGDNMAGATAQLMGVTTDSRVELYPPNLSPDIETGLGDPNNPDPAKRGYTDDLLARAIRSGLDKDDLELCPQMKHFADMSDFEVYSIVKYLRSLPPVKQKILRSVCPPLKTKEEQLAAP